MNIYIYIIYIYIYIYTMINDHEKKDSMMLRSWVLARIEIISQR